MNYDLVTEFEVERMTRIEFAFSAWQASEPTVGWCSQAQNGRLRACLVTFLGKSGPVGARAVDQDGQRQPRRRLRHEAIIIAELWGRADQSGVRSWTRLATTNLLCRGRGARPTAVPQPAERRSMRPSRGTAPA